MKWLVILLIGLIGTAAMAARGSGDDVSIVLAAGYVATIVAGIIVGRWLWSRARREQR
ncbi:hypothetical protein [Burkholderia plantarii]|uniref:hypothetical protein n=1 Tax=Burkholderia plantarii TaxID=41899 RepID=UPI0018DB0AAD|nr:hypothetical protein [Burkholderia plantarii]MBI0329736.1 hypothetical protein [Burkholderia plantarii]